MMQNNILIALFCSLIFCGCATKQNAKNESIPEELSSKESVSFEVNKSMQSYMPECISVLPFDDPAVLDKDQEFQKAFHAQLSTTGVRLVPLQANVTEKTLVTRYPNCDMKLTGLVLENNRRFYGVYSEYRAAAKVSLIHMDSGKVFWQAEHALTKRGGALPIGILSTLTGIFNATKNVEEAQTGRISYEIANQMIQTIPNLRFQESQIKNLQLKEKITIKAKNCPEAIYDFIAKSDILENEKKIQQLEDVLKTKTICRDESSQFILAQRIHQIDEENMTANDWLIRYYYAKENYINVIKIADVLNKDDPRFAKYLMRRGDSYRRMNEHEKAIEDFLSILAKDDSNERAYFFLGRSYAALGRFDIASAAFQKSLDLNDESSETLLFAGIAYAANSDADRAFEMLRRALVLEIAGKNAQKSRIILNVMHSTNTYERLSGKEKAFITTEIEKF